MTLNEKPELYTVGHSNTSIEAFTELLRAHAIQVVADVRSAPYSRYVPQFNKEALERSLSRAGIKYLHLGKELGGCPQGDEFYDEEGRVLYYRLARSSRFLEGIARLEKGIRRYRVALVCAEENPKSCHRYWLVSRVMSGRGAKIGHIRGDGTLQSHASLRATDLEQPSMFDFPEDDTWKSLQSVLPKKQPENSSGSSEETGSDALWMFD